MLPERGSTESLSPEAVAYVLCVLHEAREDAVFLWNKLFIPHLAPVVPGAVVVPHLDPRVSEPGAACGAV